MFSCCIADPQPVYRVADIKNEIDHIRRKEVDFRTTAFVLVLLGLLLSAGSFVLFGLGTLSPTALNGLGIFPYLGGAVLGFVAVGIFVGAFICLVLSSVKQSQKEKWQAQLPFSYNGS
jgi:NADH:ubiquinone oxidoreductase subunit 6 (subunit J)